MNESVTIAKETDAKRGSSSTHTSEEGIRRVQHDPERQLGSLRDCGRQHKEQWRHALG